MNTSPSVAVQRSVQILALKLDAVQTQRRRSVSHNPTTYTATHDFLLNVTLTSGATLTKFMLVYPAATKIADDTTVAVLGGFNSTTESGLPVEVVKYPTRFAERGGESKDRAGLIEVRTHDSLRYKCNSQP